MSNNRLDSVRSTLEHELDLADAEVQRLKAELGSAEKERKAIRDALAALGAKPSKKSRKPAPTKELVLQIIASLLDVNGPMPTEDLEALVKERLSEHGKSLNGFALRWKEALEDERVEVDAGGEVCLKGAKIAAR